MAVERGVSEFDGIIKHSVEQLTGNDSDVATKSQSMEKGKQGEMMMILIHPVRCAECAGKKTLIISCEVSGKGAHSTPVHGAWLRLNEDLFSSEILLVRKQSCQRSILRKSLVLMGLPKGFVIRKHNLR